MRVILDTQRLAAYGMTAGAVTAQLEQANSRSLAGSFAQNNQEFEVEAGRFIGKADDLKQVVVGVYRGKPVYLRDVAEKIVDGPGRAGRLRSLRATDAGAPKNRDARRFSRRHHHVSQAQGHQRHPHQRGGSRKKWPSCAGICCPTI